MTAEEYVVAQLMSEKYENKVLSEDIKILKAKLDETEDILNKLVSKMLINHSENYGDYIVFDRFPDEKGDPELFAEVKKLINKGEV